MKKSAEEIENSFCRIKTDKPYLKQLFEILYEFDSHITEKLFRKLLKYAEENNLSEFYPWIEAQLGRNLLNAGKALECEQLLMHAYNTFMEQRNYEGVLTCCTTLIGAKFTIKKYDEAITFAMDGIELAKYSKNIPGLMKVRANMAAVYYSLEEYDKALDIFNQLEKSYFSPAGTKKIIFYQNKALCEIAVNKLDDALHSLEIIKDSYEILPLYKFKGDIILMRIYIEKKDFKKASELLKICQDSAETKEDSKIWAEAVLYYIPVLLAQNKYKEIIKILKKVESSIEETGFFSNKKLLYSYLHTSYGKINDYESAYFWLQKFINTEEIIHKQKTTAITAFFNKTNENISKESYKILYTRNNILCHIGQKITSNLKRNEIFHIIAKELKKIIQYDSLQIILYNEYEKKFMNNYVLKDSKELKKQKLKTKIDGLTAYCIKNEKDLVIGCVKKEFFSYIKNIDNFYENSYLGNETNSVLIAKIITNGRILGCIHLQSRNKNQYTVEDIVSLKILALYTGIALENSKLYHELEYNADYDELTDLYNRRKVMSKLSSIWANPYSRNVYIGILDIDNFKKINDSFGHIEGDNVLKNVASVIKNILNKVHFAGRYGGEEFLIVINNSDNYRNFYENIRKSIEELNIVSSDKEKIPLTVSIGVTKLSHERKSIEANISAADSALYEAKNSGKNKIIYADSEKYLTV